MILVASMAALVVAVLLGPQKVHGASNPPSPWDLKGVQLTRFSRPRFAQRPGGCKMRCFWEETGVLGPIYM
jgi:hypothetical protein